MKPTRLADAMKGRARWLTYGSNVGNMCVAIDAAYYAYLTLSFTDQQRPRFLTTVVIAGTLVAVLAEIWSSRRLKTMRAIGSSRIDSGPKNVLAAIDEARGIATTMALVSFGTWMTALIGTALALRAFVTDTWAMPVRLMGMGLLFAPLAGVFAYLLVTKRARVVVQELASSLPIETVLRGVAEARGGVRTRMVLFTVIAVVLPSLMMIDVTRTQSDEVFEKVVQAPKANRATVAKQAYADAGLKTAVLGLMLLILAVGAAQEAGAQLAEPMRQVADEANRIARGELREAKVIVAEDEVWAITSTFALLHAQLVHVIATLQRAGVSISTTTEQLMATSSKYEGGAADQASSLNETSATTEELAQSARQISHNAAAVSDIAQKTLEAAREGQASAEAFAAAVDRMKQDNRSISDAVLRLQKRVQQIGKIVEFITGVADRSDLLALSAELEGTRAGEVGRGFTLVAAEMRRLAENVIESTNEIEELIGEIREATQVTVAATGQGLEQTESGTALAGSVTHALASVVEVAQRTSDSVRAISLATQQQQTSTDQLAEAMADILGITQQSLAATKQVTSANQELIALSADLKAIVEKFRVQT